VARNQQVVSAHLQDEHGKGRQHFGVGELAVPVPVDGDRRVQQLAEERESVAIQRLVPDRDDRVPRGVDRHQRPLEARGGLQLGELRRVRSELEARDAGVQRSIIERPLVHAIHIAERGAAQLCNGVVRAAEAVPEDVQSRRLDRRRIARVDRGVGHVENLLNPAAVARIVERRSGSLLGRSPGARIEVSRVVGAQVLPPHRPRRDRARKEVIEDRPEVGDIVDLLAVVADRAASGQPAAEDLGISLHRHHGAQTALRSSGLVHVTRRATGGVDEQRLSRRDELEQVAPDPGVGLDEAGGAKARAREAIAERGEQQGDR